MRKSETSGDINIVQEVKSLLLLTDRISQETSWYHLSVANRSWALRSIDLNMNLLTPEPIDGRDTRPQGDAPDRIKKRFTLVAQWNYEEIRAVVHTFPRRGIRVDTTEGGREWCKIVRMVDEIERANKRRGPKNETPKHRFAPKAASRSMRSLRYCKDRQIRWAQDCRLNLVGSQGDRGERAYAATLDENLFQPLSRETRSDFESADGNELKGLRCKMQAVHSSAALTVNVFEYWRSQSDRQPLTAALGLDSGQIVKVSFEAGRQITDNPRGKGFAKNPTLDVVLSSKDGHVTHEVGIECKFTEAYGRRQPEKRGLPPAYLEANDLWTGLPNCHRLAKHLCPQDKRFIYLHAAQLLKHILGLKHRNSKGGFQLVYLWFDVPGETSAKHRTELHEFTRIVASDDIAFHSLTYQDLIQSLAKYRDGHQAYVDYLSERYLN